jgi:hypothetical protein
LLFLNPDTEIAENVFFNAFSHLQSHEQAGAAGARLLNADGSVQMSSVQAFPNISNQVLDSELFRWICPHWRGWGTRVLLKPEISVAEVDAISGACFMVRRVVFEEVGKFDEQFFMYSDDLDLSYRIHRHGYKVHYLNDCKVRHYGGQSSSRQSEHFSDLFQRESLLLFFRATKGRSYAAVYRITVAVVAIARMALAMACQLSRRTIQGKDARSVVQKWSAIFAWALRGNAYGRAIQ